MKILRSPVALYRVARFLHCKWHVPLIPKFIYYFIRWWFCCSLPYQAQIGKKFEMGQGGMGCVVHADSIIGDDCHLGTQVTLGGNATEFGAPKLGNKVYVGTGAKILGPVVLGDHVIVGANSVVLHDVGSGSVVGGIPAKVLKTGINTDEFLFHKRTSNPEDN